MAGRSSSGTGRHARARSSAGNPSLSDLDHRILDLLSSLRVLTLPQLATISPEIPSRTLRYRTARLAKHGFVGRSRPYRERGSAPHHLWPTRKGEAIAKGEAPPRGGARREPNPLFLAHAAGLSELYVVLKTALPEGIQLAAFDREAKARETFTTYAREERAIAPDACIDVAETDGRRLLGFVELDLGTMSHRQLKAKAAGYGEYARLEAWRERNPFCPALLFITTSEKRARSFLAASDREIGRNRMLVACVGLARDLRRCVVAPEWMVGDGEQATDLLGILRAARRPYDEEEAREDAQRREEEAERDRLRSDPEALAERLRGELRYGWGNDQLGQPATDALRLSLEGEGSPLNETERGVLEVVAGMLAEPIAARLADREPTPSERAALAALVTHHRAGQLACLEEAAERFEEGPKVRRRRRCLEGGNLLGTDSLARLPHDAEQDREAATEQDRLRENYLRWREREAERLSKKHGFIARHRIGHDAFLAQVDRDRLRRCSGCEEIVYPDPERKHGGGRRHVAAYCHFCGAGVLSELPAEGVGPT